MELEYIEIKGKKYVLVKTRLQYFREHYENGRVETEILHFDNESVMIKASAYVDDKLVATGIAHEVKDASYINKTSYVEVCETSAIGRCLGIMGIGITDSVATYDEVMNAQKQQEQMERDDELREIKTGVLSSQLIAAIDNDDEDGIKEVVNDCRGDTKLMLLVKDALDPEHSYYMDERKTRLAEERKQKSADKQVEINKAAKAFAKKQKQSA